MSFLLALALGGCLLDRFLCLRTELRSLERVKAREIERLASLRRGA